eukprot:TRINITY_DN18479_c0_g1_i1.p1 TRINITY_DN18479_c0_g1~~TRINITY_DN18479_c0_g1_i1.p1  ORF type:complete len:486 (+),score=104.74 TRINITY_DN18479_c0_g1_i1:102-1460(+)
MELEVTWMVSGELVCNVHSTAFTRTCDVRKEVFARCGIPQDEQRLFSAGQELEEDCRLSTLSECQRAVQLVRQRSDPRNTNLAFFRQSLQLDQEPVGQFTFVRKIGDAIYGQVQLHRWRLREGTEERDVAVKCMSTTKIQQNTEKETNEWQSQVSMKNRPEAEDALTEIAVLQYLSNQPDLPCFLLKALCAFTRDSETWLVTEFAEGGELLGAAMNSRLKGECDVRRYTKQLLTAVSYLHCHRIGHRDISLENVLLKDDSIRLMDFGNSCQSHSVNGQELRYFQEVGKDTYRAPEIWMPLGTDSQAVLVPEGAVGGSVILYATRTSLFQVCLPSDAVPGLRCTADLWGYAAQAVDVFATGVCLFCLRHGLPPWRTAQLSDEFFAYIYASGDQGLEKLLKHWQKPLPDHEAMDLLVGMIRPDPMRRPSAKECLDHKWFQSTSESLPGEQHLAM